jgi:hypothetical protein
MAPLVIEKKVKGGKLFRLRVTSSGVALSIQLTGDFFLEPEEGIAILEAGLVDCLALSDKDEAERRLSEVIAKARLQISGFAAGDLINALWEAKP